MSGAWSHSPVRPADRAAPGNRAPASRPVTAKRCRVGCVFVCVLGGGLKAQDAASLGSPAGAQSTWGVRAEGGHSARCLQGAAPLTRRCGAQGRCCQSGPSLPCQSCPRGTARCRPLKVRTGASQCTSKRIVLRHGFGRAPGALEPIHQLCIQLTKVWRAPTALHTVPGSGAQWRSRQRLLFPPELPSCGEIRGSSRGRTAASQRFPRGWFTALAPHAERRSSPRSKG